MDSLSVLGSGLGCRGTTVGNTSHPGPLGKVKELQPRCHSISTGIVPLSELLVRDERRVLPLRVTEDSLCTNTSRQVLTRMSKQETKSAETLTPTNKQTHVHPIAVKVHSDHEPRKWLSLEWSYGIVMRT